jgi:hypothetical protein
VTVDDLGYAEPVSHGFERGNVAVLLRAQTDGARCPARILKASQKGIGRSEIRNWNRARLPVHAARLDDAPVGPATDAVLLEAGHTLYIPHT